jgi:hypothetical protein
MYKKSLLTFLLAFSASVSFAENMPSEVQDMITTLTQELNSGKARESLKINHQAKPYNPYNAESDRKVVNVKKADKFKKAKFLLDVKVISCLDEKLPEFLKDQAVKHEACGDLDAQIVYKDKVDVFLTREGRFDNLKPTKVIRTIPEVKKDGDNYVIKDKQIINNVNLGVELFVTPTKILKRAVQLDMAVRTTELASVDEIYLDSNDRSFVNNEIALKHRFLVASFPVEIGENEILGGNSAILVPMIDKFKTNSSYPETARLWLEVKLDLPKVKM